MRVYKLFIALLLITLIAMATFRSPAVALMPDVTIKPLRSKANAVINLMGSAGGILVLALGMVFATSSVKNSLMSYKVYFGVIGAVMLLALVIFLLTVKEPSASASRRTSRTPSPARAAGSPRARRSRCCSSSPPSCSGSWATTP